MTPCGDCARMQLRLHTIEVELAHRETLIATLTLRDKVDTLRDKVDALQAAAKARGEGPSSTRRKSVSGGGRS